MVAQILTRELESVGIRLNRDPPNVFFKRKKTGGVSFSSIGPLTHLDEKLVWRILQARPRNLMAIAAPDTWYPCRKRFMLHLRSLKYV